MSDKPNPGPWTATEENCGGGINVYAADGRLVLYSTRVYKGAEIVPEANAKANARLAAKAPSLAEAAREAIPLLRKLMRGGGPHSDEIRRVGKLLAAALGDDGGTT